MNVKEHNKLEAKKVHVHPRTLARKVAHANMKKTGTGNVNRKFMYKGAIFPSYFSTHWRDRIYG